MAGPGVPGQQAAEHQAAGPLAAGSLAAGAEVPGPGVPGQQVPGPQAPVAEVPGPGVAGPGVPGPQAAEPQAAGVVVALPMPAKDAGPEAWRAWYAQHGYVRAGGSGSASPGWAATVLSAPPAPIRTGTLVAALAGGLSAALLLGDGLGIGLLLATVPAVVAAYVAARAAGRTARPWTLLWSLGCLALLAVPALRDSGWPSGLAVLAAVGLAALALYGSRTWPGVLLSPFGFVDATVTGLPWAWAGLRARGSGSRDRWWPVVRAAGVALVLLVLFGTLFASADAAFADLLGGIVPDVTIGDSPLRVLLFLLGLLAALAAARAAAAPLRWDRIRVAPGRARSRVEWTLPLAVLNLLFAGFIAVQLAVLFGGYAKVLEHTGLTYAEYARQGFWQLLWATLLTLAVIALALRWAPRSGPGDVRLVRGVLGTLCLLTLVVVASALRRMDLYVDAYGLTRLRVSVAAMEVWLGLVLVLIMAAGVCGARWLPRAVVASAGAAVLAFGLLSPDGLVAEQNVARFRQDGKIDLAYFQTLSADAVPGLDELPEPQRSCALRGINNTLARAGRVPWYATSLGVERAKRILHDRPVTAPYEVCAKLGTFGSRIEH
ncbi:DUF4153 domain-containing protein [Streptomyces sp. WAC06614]|uniref:DUF4153 domain-containing protein n=1 Tax=Streptomyces sp. WAC06614 TaxID=2487416 RepID=UPI0021AF3F44|nr:DUF4153 domain-containing protein [Streptomyces sp. WAC06614]